jgi:amino acid transporter
VVAIRGRTGSVGYLKRLFVGRALASHKAEHQLLPKVLALPVFSSDPLSSVAYATEEMMLVLVLAGSAALAYKIPLAIAVALLLIIVVTSYRQTVKAYPRGGGSYIVARENLGTIPGLVAAAAILTDYVLTVAVSITAGTVAITSAFPSLDQHRVAMAIALVAMVTLANLRGVKEAGMLFAIPTYGFVAIVVVTLVGGFVSCIGGCPAAETADLPIEAEAALGLFLVARAFSSGATALTGVEAIADGVQAFRRPQAKNAATTLAVMAVISVSMFLGITALAQLFHVRINEEIAATNSVLSQIGATVFGDGAVLFLLLQVFTAGILVLAANTAFQDFPRLSSILARDRFMPSQFRNRGDRLVFSNGVLILAGLASLLIYVYDAELTRLIQLYVVGVFTAFTLSQAGMVRRWFRLRSAAWRRRALINGVGAATTGIVLVIVTITKFAKGAWVVVIAIPLIVLFFLAVHRHYQRVQAILRAGTLRASWEASNAFVLFVRDLGPATRDAVAYLRAIRPTRVSAVYVGSPEGYEATAAEWTVRAPRLGPLARPPRDHPQLLRLAKRMVRELREAPDDFVTVMIPEDVEGGLWRQILRQRAVFVLKAGLLFEPGSVLTDVPFLAEWETKTAHERPVEPERSVVLVPVAGVHDGVVRAIVYARSLNPRYVEALFMQTDPEDVKGIVDAWHDRELDVPLVFVEAPFRDVSVPLLREIRRYTSRGDTIVTVVIPELVPRHSWENVLHNQTGIFLKRLLLFEPWVVTTSVPFHLRHPEVPAPAGAPVAP